MFQSSSRVIVRELGFDCLHKWDETWVSNPHITELESVFRFRAPWKINQQWCMIRKRIFHVICLTKIKWVKPKSINENLSILVQIVLFVQVKYGPLLLNFLSLTSIDTVPKTLHFTLLHFSPSYSVP